MDNGMGLVALLGVAVLLSAYFSAAETALLSVQKVRLRQLAALGDARHQAMVRLAEHPERFLPTVLVGNNLVNAAAAALSTLVAVRFFPTEGHQGLGVVLATLAVTILLVVVGENFPKTLGSRYAERVALASAGPIIWMERLLFPLIMPLQWVNRWLNTKLGTKLTLVTQAEIKVLVTLGQESGGLQQTQSDVLLGALRVNEMRITQVMTPRTDIVFIMEGMTLERFLEFNGRQHFSRFPVFGNGGETLVGVLETRDVLRAMSTLRSTEPVTHLVHPAHYLPETLTIPEALAQMRVMGANLCLTVDEFGTVTGLATLHQFLGYIVGIMDQPSEANVVEKAPGNLVMKGRTTVSSANENLGLGIPPGDYRTVAGYLMERLGRVPAMGDAIVHKGRTYTVKETLGAKVEEIAVTRVLGSGEFESRG